MVSWAISLSLRLKLVLKKLLPTTNGTQRLCCGGQFKHNRTKETFNITYSILCLYFHDRILGPAILCKWTHHAAQMLRRNIPKWDSNPRRLVFVQTFVHQQYNQANKYPESILPIHGTSPNKNILYENG